MIPFPDATEIFPRAVHPPTLPRMALFKRQGQAKADLRAAIRELQHTCDILTAGATTSTKPGNPYPSYKSQVIELSRKYEGKADWGCQTARNIIDVRAAFIISQGVSATIVPGKAAEGELDFIRAFIARNNLDEEVPQSWAREAEIEGKFLCRLFPNPEAKQVDVRFVPWTQHSYEVHTEEQDYATYTKVTYRDKNGQDVTIPPEEFVYARYGGRTHNVNDTPPKTAAALQAIESIHRALNDWRTINNLFASPTPHFKVADVESASKLQQILKALNWKIGKYLATNAEMQMVGIDSAGVESLKSEIVALIQLISGITGIPVHFLGFPDLMSNRATAESMLDMLMGSTSAERKTWIGAYEEMFSKVLALANTFSNRPGYDVNAISADIPQVTSAKILELKEVWLPIYQEGGLSLETFLSKIPEVDPEEELSRIQKQDEDRAKRAMEAMKASDVAPPPVVGMPAVPRKEAA